MLVSVNVCEGKAVLGMGAGMKRITIKDIAKVAGVSYATVSRALNGSPEIGEDTRERILRLCKEMGYTTNYVARSMVMRHTKLIGLVVANIDNPFMSEIALHVEMHAREKGYNIMLCNSSHDLDKEEQVVELLVGRQVDGILIIPASSDSFRRLRRFSDSVPMVYVSENLKEADDSYVSVDNARGTYLGTDYLYRLGHKRILYFGRRAGSTTHQLRADGYLSVCREHGLVPLFFDSPFSASSIQNGSTLARELFSRPRDYSAIFASTDSNALGVMQVADELGLHIPGDLSLLGFDNILYSELPRINLSTIEQPKKAMASLALDMLLERIADPDVGYAHRILPPRLIERKSCLAPQGTEA